MVHFKRLTRESLLCLSLAIGCSGAGFADTGTPSLQQGKNPFVQAVGFEREAFAAFPLKASGSSLGSAAGLSSRRAVIKPRRQATQNAAGILGVTWGDNAVPGLYSFNSATGDFEKKWTAANSLNGSPKVLQTWHMPDSCKIGAIVYLKPNAWSTTYNFIEYDLSDGSNSEPLRQFYAYNLPSFASAVAYNTEDGCIYGYGFIESNKSYKSFIKAGLKDLRNPTYSGPMAVVKALTDEEYATQFCNAIAYYSVENCFYGINAEGRLVRIGLDGTQKVVNPDASPIAIDHERECGMVWSPSDNSFILSGYDADGGASIISVDFDGSHKVIGHDPAHTYPCILSLEQAIDGDSPMSPVMTGYNFPEGALKGTVSFMMPDKTRDGKALSGNMEYIVSYIVTDPATGAERTVRVEGKSEAGKEVSIDAEVAAPGYYEFAFQAIGDRQSQVSYSTVWIGNDTPVAPAHTAVQILSDDAQNPVWQFAWTPVTEGVNGGYINPDEIVYNIYLMSKEGVLYDSKGLPTDNKPAATSKGNDVNILTWSVPDALSDVSKTYFCIIVTATFNSKESEGTSSVYDNSMVPYGGPWIIDEYGRDMSTPLDITFWTYQCSENADVLPNAQDTQGTYPFAVWTMAKTTTDSDAWLFTPAVTFKGRTDGLYVLALSNSAVNTMTGWWNQSMEAFVGDAPTPSAMKTRFMDMTPSGKDANIGYLYVPEDLENKYIGIHITQGASYGYTLFQRLIVAFDNELDPAKTLMAPKLEIIPADEAHLQYTIKAICPDHYVNGEPVKAPASYRRYDLIAYDPVTQKDIPLPDRFTNRQPGIDYDPFTVKVDNSRDQYFSAYVRGVAGKDTITSLPATVKAYVGYAAPGAIRNLRIELSEDNLSGVLKWDAPIRPISNGQFDPDKLTYIVQPVFDGVLHQPILTDKTEYFFSVAPGTPLDEVIGDVNVINHDVYAPDELSDTRNAMIGEPHKLPMDEHFADNILSYEPYITPITFSKYADGLQWQLVDPSFISEDMRVDSNEAIVCSMSPNFHAGISGQAELPKFSTEGFDNVTFNLTVWTGAWKADTEILVDAYGLEIPMVIGTVPKGDGYQTVRFSIPRNLTNRKWVALRLKPTFPTQQSVLVIPSYSITASSGVTLLDVQGSRSVASGQGQITLNGYQGCKVDVYLLSGSRVASVDVAGECESVSLAPGVYIVEADGKSVKVMVK